MAAVRSQKLDFGPKERYQHGDVIEVQETIKAGVVHAVNQTSFALDWYHYHKKLSSNPEENRRLFHAGDTLRLSFTIAGLDPRVTMPYSEFISDDNQNKSIADARVDAHKQFQEAIRAIGPIASNEIVSVCCLGEYVGRGRMEILRRGLRVLADYYKSIMER